MYITTSTCYLVIPVFTYGSCNTNLYAAECPYNIKNNRKFRIKNIKNRVKFDISTYMYM